MTIEEKIAQALDIEVNQLRAEIDRLEKVQACILELLAQAREELKKHAA